MPGAWTDERREKFKATMAAKKKASGGLAKKKGNGVDNRAFGVKAAVKVLRDAQDKGDVQLSFDRGGRLQAKVKQFVAI